MTQIYQAKAARGTRPRWVELFAHNKLWARYNPSTNQIEFARNDLRVVFDLTEYKRDSLHNQKDGVK